MNTDFRARIRLAPTPSYLLGKYVATHVARQAIALLVGTIAAYVFRAFYVYKSRRHEA